MIIVIGGQKGGDGKSTTCINLAVHFLKNNFDPVIVDTDYQGSVCVFGRNRGLNKVDPSLPVLQKVDQKVNPELMSLQKKYSHVLVDAGGYDSIGFRSSLVVADVVITPVIPADLSVDTIPLINEVVSDSMHPNPALEAYLFINKAPTNPSLIKSEVNPQIDKIKKLTESGGFVYNFCDQIIYERVIYRHSITQGRGVMELSDDKAISELAQLYKEIFHAA